MAEKTKNNLKIKNNLRMKRIGRVCGLASIAMLSYFPLAPKAKAGMSDMTRVEVLDDNSGISGYQMFVKHDILSIIGEDLYDVPLSEASSPGNPGWSAYSENPSHPAVQLDVDSRSDTDTSVFNIIFDPQGTYSTSSGRVKFSRVLGTPDYSYNSPVFGSGLVSDLIQNHGGYTPYFLYDSSMGSFSMTLNPVPEPGTLGLLFAGIGTLGIGKFLRKKKKNT